MRSQLTAFVFVFAAAGTGFADAVTNWNSIATRASAAAGQNGIVQTRTYAIAQIAVHDALNAIERRYRPYLLEALASTGASPDAAVAAAAHAVLTELAASARADIDTAYQASIAAIPDGSSETEGVAIGRAAAAAILRRRANDGSADAAVWSPGVLAGQYRPTPPANAAALLPGWGNVLPFAVRTITDYRTAPPPDLFS